MNRIERKENACAGTRARGLRGRLGFGCAALLAAAAACGCGEIKPRETRRTEPEGRPNLHEVLLGEGTGRFSEAARQYREYLRTHPDDAVGFFELGELLLHTVGDYEGAMYCLQQAQYMMPGSALVPIIWEYEREAWGFLYSKYKDKGQVHEPVLTLVERVREKNRAVSQKEREIAELEAEYAAVTNEVRIQKENVRNLTERKRFLESAN